MVKKIIVKSMFQMKRNIMGKDLGNFMRYGNSPKELNGYKTDKYIYILKLKFISYFVAIKRVP